jgi:CRP-like cAMP-binding protein
LSLDRFLSSVAAGKAIKEYSQKKLVYSEEDPADAVYFVRRGEVVLGCTSLDGREAVLGIIGAGQFFGEECLLQQKLRRTTAKTLTVCLLTRIDKKAIIPALQDHPDLYATLFARLVERMTRLEANLRDLLLYPGEKRLACTLWTLAKLGTDGKRVIPKMSQETLAQLTGMARSRVCVTMNEFRVRGFLAWDRDGIEVRDSLRTVCDDKSSKPSE